jgi:hypothetical protein
MDYFYTLVRTSGSYTSLGLSMLEMMRYFGWKRAILFSDPDPTPCFYGAQAIHQHFDSPEANLTFFTWVLMAHDPAIDDIDAYLARAKNTSRGVKPFCLIRR